MQRCQHCRAPTDTKDWSIWCQDRTKYGIRRRRGTKCTRATLPTLPLPPPRGERVLPFAQQHLPLAYSPMCRPPPVERIKAGAMMPGNLPSVAWLACTLPHFSETGSGARHLMEPLDLTGTPITAANIHAGYLARFSRAANSLKNQR